MNADVINHLDSLSNEQLLEAFETAQADLAQAAEKEPNSEWHESCFAALFIYCTEIGRRGLRRQAIH